MAYWSTDLFVTVKVVSFIVFCVVRGGKVRFLFCDKYFFLFLLTSIFLGFSYLNVVRDDIIVLSYIFAFASPWYVMYCHLLCMKMVLLIYCNYVSFRMSYIHFLLYSSYTSFNVMYMSSRVFFIRFAILLHLVYRFHEKNISENTQYHLLWNIAHSVLVIALLS